MVVKLLGSMLSRHAKYATVVAVGVMSFGLWVWSHYEGRGDWYANYGSSRPILIAFGVAAIASFLATGSILDRQRRPRGITWMLPGAVVVGCMLFVGVRWIYPWPSIAGAQAAFDAGDIDRARLELDAVDARSGSPGAEQLRVQVTQATAEIRAEQDRAYASSADDKRLDQVGDGTLQAGAALVLHRTWADPAKQELARKRLVARARAMADEEWKDDDGPALARIAADTAGLDTSFTRQTEQRSALATARTCLDESRLDCVRTALALLEQGEALTPELDAIRIEIAGQVVQAQFK